MKVGSSLRKYHVMFVKVKQSNVAISHCHSRTHTAYEKFIIYNKLGHIGLYGNKLKWIIGTHGHWKNQNPGVRFGATS